MKLTNKLNVTDAELKELKDAVYMISDAKSKIENINNAMKREGRWYGQGNIAAVVSNLDELCSEHAGGIGQFLQTL